MTIDFLRPLPPALPGRTLILGAGGFLGSQAARWLARANGAVRLFDLSVDSIPADVRCMPGVEVVHGNVLDDLPLRRALEGISQVLHFVSATVPATSVDQVDMELRANVEPMIRLLEAMRAVGTPLLVFPSSGGTIYGDPAPEHGFTERMQPCPTGSYALGKLLIEEIMRFHARSGGPDCLILRISNAYGPSVREHDRQGVINAFLDRVRSRKPIRIWGDGSAVRDYVHVEDIFAAVSALVHGGIRNDVYNVGSGRGWSVRQVLDLIEQTTGLRASMEQAPGEYPGVRRNVLDTSRLQRDTGWTPQVALPAGVAHLWRTLNGR